MKKFKLASGAALLFVLSACGTEEALGKADVLDRSIEAAEDLEGYSMTMEMAFEIMEMESKLEAEGDVTHDPDTAHLLMSMGMMGMTMEFEVYLYEDEAYMSMFGEWIKMDPEELGADDFNQVTKEDMEKYAEYIEDFEMAEEQDVYILTLTGEGDEFSVLIEDLVQSSLGDFQPEQDIEEYLEDIRVNSLEMELHIDKETYLQTVQIVKADIEISEDGESLPMKIDARVNISDFNEVEPVEIPEEVRENAVEDFMDVDDDLLFDDEYFEDEQLSFEEIQERTGYKIPEFTEVPEGYAIAGTYYDQMMDMVYIEYEKDSEYVFMLTAQPIDSNHFTSHGTEVIIQGNEGRYYEDELYPSLKWVQEGLSMEITAIGEEFTEERLIEMAESLSFE